MKIAACSGNLLLTHSSRHTHATNYSQAPNQWLLSRLSRPYSYLVKIPPTTSTTQPHSTSELPFGSLNTSTNPSQDAHLFHVDFFKVTTDQSQTLWLSNPSRPRLPPSTPNQYNNNEFVLFDEPSHDSKVFANRQARQHVSPLHTPIDNRQIDHFGFDRSATLLTQNVSTVHNHPGHNPISNWTHFWSLNTDTIRSNTSRRSNMAAENTMEDHMDQAATAAAAGFDDQPLEFGYQDDVFNMDETVSPNDLSLTHNGFSHAPYSTTFTDLTTPGLIDDESPFLNDSLEVSPAFESAGFGSNAYLPLFPTEEYLPAKQQSSKRTRDADVATPVSAPMSRNASSQSVNEANKDEHELLRQRLALTAGIPKSTRRATKVLQEIEVDEDDERAVKRRKNTLAARKSRQKKNDEVMLLQSRILELEKEKNYWKMTAIRFGAPIPENETPSPSAMSPS